MLRLILLILCISLCSPLSVEAALRSANTLAGLDEVVNPHAEADDIVLPMPCGLSLVLRTVAVPGGVSRDRRFQMGVSNAAEQRQIYESSFESHIAASFALADLPENWQSRLGVGQPESFSYYFIGKYELSQGQWESVMETIGADATFDAGRCPSMKASSALPVRNVSWFAVQDFLRRYNAWLIREAKTLLPHYAGTNSLGFLRLPTEEEWEFAARGGIAVREEDRENNDSFVPQGEKASDYGVFLTEGAAIREQPLAIGSRKPNPLELYDTMGNVREMIDGFFHLTIMEIGADNSRKRRLHGASGGLLCKGGSFRSDAAGVLPGWRDEVPLYSEHGEYTAADLGARLVLAGIAIPGASRLQLISGAAPAKTPEPVQKPRSKQEAQQEVGTQEQLLTLNMQGDVLSELDRISNATRSSVVRANLTQLRNLISQREQAEKRREADVLENTLRSTLYQAETIRAFAFRYTEIAKLLRNGQNNHPLTKEEKAQAQEVLNSYYNVLLTAANQYKSHLRRIVQSEEQNVQNSLAHLQKEYQGNDTLSRHMQGNLTRLEEHLIEAKQSGFGRLSAQRLCRDIIPKQHLEQMPHFVR